MEIFCDFHHAGLLHSLILLFEKRLGGELYRPIGTEWFDKGYWKVYDHPATVAQFLGINGATPDGSDRLNDVVKRRENDVYLCHDITSLETNKAITLEGFLERKFDIVIASIPQHIIPFRKLCDLHPNHPKLIYQIGNVWNISDEELNYVKNFMASARIENVRPDINLISYHQEFDTNVFKPSDNLPLDAIYSFVNCFSLDNLFAEDWQLFQDVEKQMPEFKFGCFGGQCRDGAAHGEKQLAEFMSSAKFIWHTKNGGDGYGHVLYNSAAIGKPTINKIQYYRGKMGEELLEDGVTCVGIDGLGMGEIINKINYYSESQRYKQMCENVYQRFKEKVNFDDEEVKLRNFLKNLL